MTSANVSTPEECVAYVTSVGICAWRSQPKYAWLPSLENATAWSGAEVTNQTWFWKDDLHIERKLFFGMLLAPDIPVFVSLAFLPYLIAAQGDIDADALYEKGLIASNAHHIYQHILRNGTAATAAIPMQKGSRMLYLASLQQKFLLTKCGLTGRTRGTYGYLWNLCEEVFPESFEAAGRISVAGARDAVAAQLRGFGGDATLETAARMFRWQPL